MRAVDFPESNTVHTREDCYDLHTCITENKEYGCQEIISCWELSDEDLVYILKSVKEGIRPHVMLSVLGGQPPVNMWLGEKNGD